MVHKLVVDSFRLTGFHSMVGFEPLHHLIFASNSYADRCRRATSMSRPESWHMTPGNTETSHNTGFLSSADKVFIYLGALALAALAVIAAAAYKNLNSSGRNTTGGPGLTAPPPANVIVGHLNTGECFVYFDSDGGYPTLASSPASTYPTKIVWQSVLPPGSNHVFTITFNDSPFQGGATIITVPVSGSSTSGTYQVAAGKDRSNPYPYTIQDSTDPHDPCRTTVGPVGVIVQK